MDLLNVLAKGSTMYLKYRRMYSTCNEMAHVTSFRTEQCRSDVTMSVAIFAKRQNFSLTNNAFHKINNGLVIYNQL